MRRPATLVRLDDTQPVGGDGPAGRPAAARRPAAPAVNVVRPDPPRAGHRRHRHHPRRRIPRLPGHCEGQNGPEPAAAASQARARAGRVVRAGVGRGAHAGGCAAGQRRRVADGRPVRHLRALWRSRRARVDMEQGRTAAAHVAVRHHERLNREAAARGRHAARTVSNRVRPALPVRVIAISV
eukprot:scaffold5311_cov120-Isochrysis_galbana.AAC.7